MSDADQALYEFIATYVQQDDTDISAPDRPAIWYENRIYLPADISLVSALYDREENAKAARRARGWYVNIPEINGFRDMLVPTATHQIKSPALHHFCDNLRGEDRETLKTWLRHVDDFSAILLEKERARPLVIKKEVANPMARVFETGVAHIESVWRYTLNRAGR